MGYALTESQFSLWKKGYPSAVVTHDSDLYCAYYWRETLASVLAHDPGPEIMRLEIVDKLFYS
jgi:hypothetical protein